MASASDKHRRRNPESTASALGTRQGFHGPFGAAFRRVERDT